MARRLGHIGVGHWIGGMVMRWLCLMRLVTVIIRLHRTCAGDLSKTEQKNH